MSSSAGKKSKQASSGHTNAAFDVEPAAGTASSGGSPMGSNIFIVKPEGEHHNRVHPEPYRHEPVTRSNVGRTILRGIRCKQRSLMNERTVPVSPSFSSFMGDTSNGKGSTQEQRSVRENDHSRIGSLLGLHHHSVHQ